MLNNKFADYVAYFRNLAQNHKELKTFVHGTAADIMGKSRSDLEYPCLWLETPYLKIQANEASEFSAKRVGAFTILWNAPEKTETEIDLIWQQTEEICLDVLSILLQDKKKKKFHFSPDGVSVDPISTLFIDNDYGWRVELMLDKYLNLCFNPQRWNS